MPERELNFEQKPVVQFEQIVWTAREQVVEERQFAPEPPLSLTDDSVVDVPLDAGNIVRV